MTAFKGVNAVNAIIEPYSRLHSLIQLVKMEEAMARHKFSFFMNLRGERREIIGWAGRAHAAHISEKRTAREEEMEFGEKRAEKCMDEIAHRRKELGLAQEVIGSIISCPGK